MSAQEVDREQGGDNRRGRAGGHGRGVDIHSHVAGSKVNAARKFRPEDHYGSQGERTTHMRSGSRITPFLPHILTGYLYAENGLHHGHGSRYRAFSGTYPRRTGRHSHPGHGGIHHDGQQPLHHGVHS